MCTRWRDILSRILDGGKNWNFLQFTRNTPPPPLRSLYIFFLSSLFKILLLLRSNSIIRFSISFSRWNSVFFFFEDLLHFSDSSLSFSLVIHYFLSFQRRNVRINVRPCEISRPSVVIFHLSPFIFHVSCALSLSLSRVKYSRQGVLILPSFSFFPPLSSSVSFSFSLSFFLEL